MGDKVIIADWALLLFEDTSIPIFPTKTPVVVAGYGFVTLTSVTVTFAMGRSVVMAPKIVKVLLSSLKVKLSNYMSVSLILN